MSNNGSFTNERTSAFEGEYAADPATGGFFHSDFKKHDDLKIMLDSNKDNLKLEAMKRIIGMVAKGRDASMLFPAVVKNVVSKNIEIKKLVYVYLERYAEEQQDLALLSISTFQRALKEPNPLIRAGALRVLSSVRVKMISPIVMLAIKDASSDMSSYVRKTAAHAIPKLHGLDPELKPELITIIQKLLADKTVLVIGSAVMAFTEVCPERIDLIHAVYRKLCALIIDVDEWGQVTIVNMLTRYARMQFADPNIEYTEKVQSGEESNSDSSIKAGPTLDPDHRLLLRSTKPLLQSRNAAVVMAVAQLYHHTAPKTESIWTAKALVRLLRSHIEVQTIVLNIIASISSQNKQMFEPYLKTFFVRTSDPTNIKLLKLEILTNLSSDTNISTILRELQTYITHTDKRFVSATIQAIGRCACSISEITDSCLTGLVMLLSNKDEAVVAESVVVIKRLLQTQAADPKEIITYMARLLDNITVAQARAAILWLLGEHSQKVPLIAPDVLRKLAKSFSDEDDIVKMQVMNLAVKLYITNPEQCTKLFQYVLNLARYDQNYDIRDKSRFLRHCVLDENGSLKSCLERIFLAEKPAPQLQSQFKDYEGLQLGSLSHYIKQRAHGYEPLPSFPEVPPSGECRNVEPLPGLAESKQSKYSDKWRTVFSWETSEAQEDSNNSNSNSSSEASSSSESDSEESSGSEEEEEEGSSSEDKKSKSSSGSGSYTSTEESSSDGEGSSSPSPEPKDTKLGQLLDLPQIYEGTSYAADKLLAGGDKPSEIKKKKSSSSQKRGKGKQPSNMWDWSHGEPKPTSEPERPKLNPLLDLTKTDEDIIKGNAKPPPSEGKDSGSRKTSVTRSNLELLLELDESELASMPDPVMLPSFNETKVSTIPSTQAVIRDIQPTYVDNKPIELLNRINGRGLSASYRYTRMLNVFQPRMVNINIMFTNHSDTEITNIRLGKKFSEVPIQDISPLAKLAPNCSLSAPFNVDFCDSTRSISFEFLCSLGSFTVSLKPSIGELVKPVTMPESLYVEQQKKMQGMSEHSKKIPSLDSIDIAKRISEVANLGSCPPVDSDIFRYAGKTMAMSNLILVTINRTTKTVIVNCENPVFGSILLDELVNKLLTN